MTASSRDAVLGALRSAVRRDGDVEAARKTVEARLAGRARGTIPARGQLSGNALCDLFADEARAVDATVARVGSPAEVPAAVAEYLRGENLPTEIRMAPNSGLDAYPWADASLLQVARGKAEASDMVSVTGALAGIAETGSLMLVSGPDTPTTLNFLPDAHVVVLRAVDMVGSYEDAFDRLRARGAMPRTVNIVTGPSRSGDIEQKLQLGAHGPRWLHIVLVEGDG